MNRSLILFFLLALITIILPAKSFSAYQPEWKWKTVRTEHFTIYYPEGHEAFAQRIYRLTDEVYKDVTDYFGTKPPRCPIVINPGTDLLNGYYSPFPNRISLYETPPFHLRGFGPASDIADTVFTHEFTHFVHITAAAGWYKQLTTVLGSGLRISNILSPGWAIEGITTNAETLFADGGRGRCSYFKGQILSCIDDEKLWNLSAAGTYPPYTPPGNRFYLAGYYMVHYLNDRYGKDAFAKLSRHQAKHPVGGISEALQFVTGKKPSDFYKDFTAYMNGLNESVKTNALSSGLPQGKTLFSDKYDGIVSHFWTADNTIVALRAGYEKKHALLEILPETGRVLREVLTGRIKALPPIRKLNNEGDIVFSGVFPHIFAAGQLDSTDITIYNMHSNNFTRATRNMHIYSADISPDQTTFVAAKRNRMWIDLVLIDNNSKNCRSLISIPGYLFEAPAWSPDGKQIVSVVKTGQNADIALIHPGTGKMKTIFASDIYEDNDPVFSPDGKWIVFSSNRTGIWNIFAWNVETAKLFQLTSVFYGATEPRISPDGKHLSFLSLEKGLKKLCAIAFEPEKGIEVMPENSQKNSSGRIDNARLNPEITFTPSRFPLFEAYKPYLHIPYFAADDESKSFGLWIQGGDPVGINTYSASLSYIKTSDISDAQDDGTDEHLEYDILVTNASFWPTLQFQTSNEVKNGGSFWFSEKKVELSAVIPITPQVMPSYIQMYLTGGSRYRHQKSLTDSVSFFSNRNDATSLFGELLLTRYPDFAQRDIIPTHGQEVFAVYEKGIRQLGDEMTSRNILLSAKQYFPSFIKHNGIELVAAYQDQKGLSYSKELSIPRGYSGGDSDGGLNLAKNILVSGEYHFPIAYPDMGLGLSTFHVNALKSSLFFDYGAGWDNKFEIDHITDIARKSVGASLTCRASVYTIFNIETGVEAGYKVNEKEGFASFVFKAAF